MTEPRDPDVVETDDAPDDDQPQPVNDAPDEPQPAEDDPTLPQEDPQA